MTLSSFYCKIKSEPISDDVIILDRTPRPFPLVIDKARSSSGVVFVVVYITRWTRLVFRNYFLDLCLFFRGTCGLIHRGTALSPIVKTRKRFSFRIFRNPRDDPKRAEKVIFGHFKVSRFIWYVTTYPESSSVVKFSKNDEKGLFTTRESVESDWKRRNLNHNKDSLLQRA